MSFQYELRFLEAGLDNLESYLLSNDLYWPPGIQANYGEPPYPSLTPGSILLAKKKAEIQIKESIHKTRMDTCQVRWEQITSQWKVAWNKKSELDFQARLRLWRDFLDDLREKPEAHSDRYRYEITRRVQQQLLQTQQIQLEAEQITMLSILDKRLRTILKPGLFIWETDLEVGFPPDEFWYLYGDIQG
jgi:hypothetical protein